MAIFGSPLFMGGDEVEHPAELLRVLVWSIYRGQEGWLTSTAGRCETRAIPGQGVRVLPGPFVINSRFVGGAMQAYLSGIINDEDVPVSVVPSGWSGGYRYDLVVANIEDPYPSNGAQWPIPNTSEGRRLGPYWKMRVVEDVPANCISLEQIPANHPSGARTWTAIPSARLKRPAGTATVTAEMITRLNVVCNPLLGVQLPPDLTNELNNLEDLLSDVIEDVGDLQNTVIPLPDTFTDVNDVLTNKASNVLNSNQLSYKRFPEEAMWELHVPAWATNVDVFFIASGVYQKATAVNLDANVYATTQFKLTQTSNTSNIHVSETNPHDMDEINWSDNRAPVPDFGTYLSGTHRPGNRPPIITIQNFTVPSSMRGKKIRLEHMMKMTGDPTKNSNGRLVADTGVNVYIAVKWRERS